LVDLLADVRVALPLGPGVLVLILMGRYHIAGRYVLVNQELVVRVHDLHVLRLDHWVSRVVRVGPVGGHDVGGGHESVAV